VTDDGLSACWASEF